jgi:polyisoprenoid-binding protein YceI
MTASTLVTRTFDDIVIPQPGRFVIDPLHTTVGFVARHLVVSTVRGSFGEVSGVIIVSEDPLASSVQASIGAASITTGAPDRDSHLRSPDFLNAATFPFLTFRSLRVARHSGAEFVLVGELTIRDVTRAVELAVGIDGVVRNPYGHEVIGFTASTEIDREEFGMTWNVALEAGGVLVGKKVKIEISAEATRES